jgi:hypothetical protein
MLEQDWFIQVLLGFDDNKVLKNNWYTNICSSVHDLLIMKKELMKNIKKGLGSLEDYGGRSTGRSTRSQCP